MNISDLETLFNFDKDDLDANRNGFLSEQQRNTIEKSILRNEQFIKIIWIVSFLVIVVGIITDFWVHNIITKPTLTYSTVGICMVGTVNYVSIIMNRNSRNALQNGTVEAIQGQVSKFKKQKARSLAHDYFISVGDIRFSISAKQCKCLTDNDIYTIYYTPSRKMLVSLEKLDL